MNAEERLAEWYKEREALKQKIQIADREIVKQRERIAELEAIVKVQSEHIDELEKRGLWLGDMQKDRDEWIGDCTETT